MNMHDNRDFFTFLNGKLEVPKEYIFERVPRQSDDLILIAGTLVEGIGNIHSDLDIYVFTNQRPSGTEFEHSKFVSICDEHDNLILPGEDSIVHSTFDYFGNDGVHVDIVFITYDEIENLFQRVRDAYLRIRQDSNPYYPRIDSSLTSDDEKLFHRLCNGIALTNGDRLSEILTSQPVNEFCFCAYREFSPNYFRLKDVQGAWISGQLDVAREVLRKEVVYHMRSLTHLNLNTSKGASGYASS